jgi:hypothetical protein
MYNKSLYTIKGRENKRLDKKNIKVDYNVLDDTENKKFEGED